MEPMSPSRSTNRTPCRRPRRLFASPGRFWRDDDGGLLVFGLFVFVIMLLVGGMAVDFMRFETRRADVQGTLDRAVLAAADLDQTRPAEEVVNDYFAKAGLSDTLTGVRPDGALNYRTVAADATTRVDTLFLDMIDIEELSASISAAASERIPNVEISLVLDISGSMRFDGRMANLRPAAKQFVSLVLNGDAAATTTINLIPYAGQTNPGPDLFGFYGAEPHVSDGVDLTPLSSCIELRPDDMAHSGPPQRALQEVPGFMQYTIAADVMDWGWCPEDDTAIQYASNDEADLLDFIDDLRMHDGTGTHYAMRYAVSLLDPDSNPAFRHLAGLGVIDESFVGRPSAWRQEEWAKYIVLMTDGQITDQYRPSDPVDPRNATVELENRPSGERKRISTGSDNVQRFYAMCDLAKANGVTIFTIAFDAPGAARTQMAACASSPTHFFDVDVEEIDEAFSAIANQIIQLRLIQ